MTIMEQAKARREALGFRLTWVLPEGRTFTAYAKDAAQKDAWLIDAVVKGWELVQ